MPSITLPPSLFAELPERSPSVYALESCLFAANMEGGREHHAIAAQCRKKLRTFRRHYSIPLAPPSSSFAFDSSSLTAFSSDRLVALHAAGKACADWRRKKKMELFTRAPQWSIVGELLRRDASDPVARLLHYAESLEAAAHARHLGMHYRTGEYPAPFDPSAYPDDASLIRYIRSLSRRADYLSRETLIDIADHIQTYIVDPGTTADHIDLVAAILDTGMPSFSYPVMVKALEKTTAALAKTNARTRLDLAPAYYILWTQTLKQTYLNLFQTTIRHCYSTLAYGRQYPGLGVDSRDLRSLTAAIRFLDDNRQTLWALDTRHDLDKVIRKYDDILMNAYSGLS